MGGITLKNAIDDDDNFISALKALSKFATKDDLGDKADKSALDGKADKSELANKADKSALDGKADKSELANKADATALTNKADKSELLTYDKSGTPTPITTVDDLLTKLTTGTDKEKKVYTEKAVDDAFVTTGELATKVADKDVVKAIFGAKEQPTDTQSILATKVADKDIAATILGAKDGQKSVLVEKLETFFGEGHKVYSNNTKTAKELLVPSAGDLLKDQDFKSGIDKSIKDMAVASNPEFQGAVREVMLQPFCKIPGGENEPMCCYDPHPTCLLGA
ncbi:MAG: hypothetical protein LBJ80_02635 [Rickettsiales bacterium]|nr:hypothetical protein [Rickettsiales bacterium]MDR1261297.1 hypothetical protein [Rickettsiales bacterium]